MRFTRDKKQRVREKEGGTEMLLLSVLSREAERATLQISFRGSLFSSLRTAEALF